MALIASVAPLLGAIFALIVVSIFIAINIISQTYAIVYAVSILLIVWMVIYYLVRSTGLFLRKKYSILEGLYGAKVMEVLGRYGSYIKFPSQAAILSSILESMRTITILYAGVYTYYTNLYMIAFSVFYFFLAGSLCSRLNPGGYIGRDAAKGDQDAQVTMCTIEEWMGFLKDGGSRSASQNAYSDNQP